MSQPSTFSTPSLDDLDVAATSRRPSSRGPVAPTAERRVPERSARRARVEAVAFVAVWVASGYALHLDANAYLLLGIPLTLGFQVLVRRRPVRELFAAGATRFRLSTRGLALALALAAVPAVFAWRALAGGDPALVCWYLAAVVGAFAAAFALGVGSVRAALRAAATPIAIGSGGMALVYGALHLATGTPVSATGAVAAVATYTALYFPATFLLEEVAFRGAIDAHVHRQGTGRDWRSAVFVSVLWGLWHLPVAHGLPWPLQLVELVVVHVVIGVPLSFAWRRHRNLAGPALAHAVIDAVRNASMLGL
ncbi:type II CAAX prenyl endopeptidase Rce1 family protein [Actinotalea sp.]|uniref:CPBP family glutamic-type intramembrane protease n=1 Tax=Actinotalea sp. TaxID=1872145 RepID=UPI0035686C12